MAKKIFDDVSKVGVALNTNGDSWIFTETSAIMALDASSTADALSLSGRYNEYTINGLVVAAYEAGIVLQGLDQKLIVGTTGVVSGVSPAISILGSDNSLVNYGRVYLSQSELFVAAIVLSGPNSSFENHGYVYGETYAIGLDASGSTVRNYADGYISSGQTTIVTAYLSSNPQLNLFNAGTIEGSSYAIYSGSVADTVRSSGQIIGDIRLGAGDDLVVITGGNIVGNILGGADQDTLVTNISNISFVEEYGGGVDTVKSSVSFTLGAHVEMLILTGKKNINGNGSATGDNFIYGNSGQNVIRGNAGYNEMYGRVGNDHYWGGADYDLFGLEKNTDRDTVHYFNPALDQIDINGWGAKVDTYDELKSRIEKHGADVWIDMGGGDILVLLDTTRNELTSNNFIYNYG